MRSLHDPSALFLRRGIHTIIAVAAFYEALRVPYQRLADRRILQAVFFACFVMLILVFFSPAQGGSHRWLVLFGRIRFQPSELAKLFAVVYAAARLSRCSLTVDDFRSTALPPIIIVGSLTLLVLAEPDLGSAVVLAGVPAVLFFAAGLHRKFMSRAFFYGSTSLILALVLARYRFTRIREWLEYVFGISPPTYQLDQSLLAVGNGGYPCVRNGPNMKWWAQQGANLGPDGIMRA